MSRQNRHTNRGKNTAQDPAEGAKRTLNILKAFENSARDSGKRTTRTDVIRAALNNGMIDKSTLTKIAGFGRNEFEKVRKGQAVDIAEEVRTELFGIIRENIEDVLSAEA